MAKKIDLSDKTLSELTIEEILDYVADKVPAIAVGVLIPDDGDTCKTVTYTAGNRCAVVGLATLTKKMAIRKLMKSCVPSGVAENEETGDEESR